VTTKGYFELMIKVYEQGKISKYMHSLNVGDEVEFKGPTGSFKYTPNQWKNIGMLAGRLLLKFSFKLTLLSKGGSGITPMLQVIRTILHDTEDKTILSLVFSNSTGKDVFLSVIESIQRG
jgi:cytochrome-b5 reductase